MLPEPPLIIRHLGLQQYNNTFNAMKKFNKERNDATADEIWFVEHYPVFTQGQAGKEEYILVPGDIPVVKSDRGGHVTYHGPGQITAYLLIDLRRLNIGVRQLVSLIEKALIDTLNCWNISASPRREAPGVYVDNGEKIASLGLRIRKGCSYHGLNFNINMDMSPWQRINPCGLGVVMTQVADLVNPSPNIKVVSKKLAEYLTAGLGYNEFREEQPLPHVSD
ncbi:MAG: lipoyl(octanoyl) transferase LipB [Porticoccaceae bacterium]|jgi:lipoyl(octanoyl) transferase|nr:lipoyl(octanoyl) transferase LipB [Porticoccaceae bacterium]MBT3797298.1 lipoyl(octanoyl) transferase LipB [Porticoccaceae bacterium]MBT4164798.1 lipoyl(octanoyl) transferase LipB [Porticoccaceae bacterium]MBT4211251.1 lipoyl(octanoyl) transferase LipB [Porticoccaceae bacterium]MBT4590725.1 lipoyl(octanoyl) transferase LipB [Porticoccaceae bacterium]